MQICENYILPLKAKKCIFCSLLIKYPNSVQMHGCVFPYTGRKWSVSLPYSCDSPPQWIGDDRRDIGFGIHMISEIPCACWWAWQCLFSSFYTQISLCWFILEQIKTITMCVCMHYYYLKKPSDISCSFSTPASHYSPAHPGETLFVLRACIVWVLASAQGLL